MSPIKAVLKLTISLMFQFRQLQLVSKVVVLEVIKTLETVTEGLDHEAVRVRN